MPLQGRNIAAICSADSERTDFHWMFILSPVYESTNDSAASRSHTQVKKARKRFCVIVEPPLHFAVICRWRRPSCLSVLGLIFMVVC